MQILEQISEVASSDIEIPELPAKGTVFWRTKEKSWGQEHCAWSLPKAPQLSSNTSRDDIWIPGKSKQIHVAVGLEEPAVWIRLLMEGVSLKLYTEGEMPGHLVYGVCCCLFSHLLGAVHPVRWAWDSQPFARQSSWPKLGYRGCAPSVLWQRVPFPHPSAKALAPLDSESRQRRHCQKWERWSGGLRDRLLKWGRGRMLYFLSAYTDEGVPSARGGNSVQVYKSMDLTWPVRSRQTKPAPFVKSWPFSLSFSPSVNSWWCVSSGTPLQIIFSKISFSISYWQAPALFT